MELIKRMEAFLTIAVVVCIASWSYTNGKRKGSKAAFKVGWRKGRRSRKYRS